MKNIFMLLLFFLLIEHKTSAQVNPKYPVDTIKAGTMIFVGSNVYSFNEAFSVNGVLLEKAYNGPAMRESAPLKPGSVVLADHIMAIGPAGTSIRLPDKKYVVR